MSKSSNEVGHSIEYGQPQHSSLNQRIDHAKQERTSSYLFSVWSSQLLYIKLSVFVVFFMLLFALCYFLSLFSFFYTVQRRRSQHARTLTPINTRTQTQLLWAPPKNWTGRSWDSRSHHWRLVVDGNVAYHLTHNAGKSWNKSRKVRAPCQVEDLNPGG